MELTETQDSSDIHDLFSHSFAGVVVLHQELALLLVSVLQACLVLLHHGEDVAWL